MQSAFTPKPKITATTTPFLDESYNLRGLDLITPDQVMTGGESPFNLNSRMYARNDGESRVAIRTRLGSIRLNTAQGETLGAQNVAAQTGDVAFSPTRIIAQPFTAGSTGVLSRIDLELKRIAGSQGHVMVEVAADAAGLPGQILANSSILSSNILTSYGYLPAYFIDAPTLTNAVQYWLILSVQDNGAGSYNVRQTADTGSLDMMSVNGQVSWSPLGASFHFKSYMALDTGVKGYHRRYPSNGANRTLYAAAGSIYSSTDAGVVTELDNTLNVNASYVRFAFVNDQSIWVNGSNNPRTWDGTTVTDLAGAPAGATHVIVHQGRLFFVINKTLVRFSELYDFVTYPSVNFFYVPDPKSSDPVTGLRVFQDNLLIFTHNSKHTVLGSDISSFTRKEAIGTKGAVSDEAIAVDRNYAYFMADDGNIYAWNGSTDVLVSDRMEPEFSSIADKTKVRLHLYRNQLRVYYAKSPSAFNNCMAVLDISQSNFATRDFQWFKDTGRPVVGSLAWGQDNNQLIEFSSRTPWMFQGESSYSDLGKAIDWKYWTNYKTYGYRRRTGQSFGGGSAKKRVKRFRPILRTVAADFTMLVGHDFDFNDTPDMRPYLVSGGGSKWGGSGTYGSGLKFGKKKLVDNKSAMSGRGHHIQYRFERYGVETPAELYGYISQIKMAAPK